jgi:predicted ATPase
MAEQTRIYEFGSFRLDAGERRLLRDARPIPLRAKVLDTLCALVQAHGRLIDKEELIKRVWPDAIVEEGNLAHNISVLRKSLGEPITGQKYIETVPGRGYRFVAEVNEVHPWEGAPVAESRPPASVIQMVQRHHDLRLLEQHLEKAAGGTRQVVFITGEAGIGKTTLVNAFVTQAHGKVPLWSAYGQCLEYRGEGEAYMPVLEALGRMCREASGQSLIALLARCAPTWLVQMPWLLTDAELEALQPRVRGATRERMLREMVEAVETLTVGRPLLLVLEDLHWSDHSTLDLLVCLARRREPARLFLIGTYRPGDVRLRDHPLQSVERDLKVHGLCEELPLAFLDEEGTRQYLATRFPDWAFPPGLPQILYRRTEGNPLFITNVVDDWVSRSMLAKPPEELGLTTPESLREFIERQLALTGPGERTILEAASVAGRELAVAAVAAAIEQPEQDVETRCDSLARLGQFLTFCGTADWPDGTVSARYAFTHDLYRETLYARILPARRTRLHQRIGVRLEEAYGPNARGMAAELTVHFVEGRDARRAVQYLQYAAQQALTRNAHREAIGHLSNALRFLESLPPGAERDQCELELSIALGASLLAAKGYSTSEVGRVYTRARSLCQCTGRADQHLAALWGSFLFHTVRAELQEARELSLQFLGLAKREENPPLLAVGHLALGASLFHFGESAKARENLERAMAHAGPDRDRVHLLAFGPDAGVFSLSYLAHVLWGLGYPDQALQKSQEAVALAHDLSHPFSLAIALAYSAMLHQFRGEEQAGEERANEAAELCRSYGFPYYLAWTPIIRGWALVQRGSAVEGIERMCEGLAALKELGAELRGPYYRALLAQAYGDVARPSEGLKCLAEAFALAHKNKESWIEADLHRIEGDLLLQRADRQAAQASYRRALDVASQQGLKSLELRAATSLARLWLRQDEHDPARALLERNCDGFTEGFDTQDFKEARSLLEEIDRCS